MADLRRFGLADLVLLLVVLGLAGATRSGYLMVCADGGRSPGPLRVQDPSPTLVDFPAPEGMRGAPRPTEQDALIHNLVEHQWFGTLAPWATREEQTAHVSPGYPWSVALLARAVPPDKLDSTARWIQVGLGTLTAGLYFLFARRAFRSRTVGVLAGLLTALHPFWVINVAELQDGVLTSFLLALALFLGSRSGEVGGPFSSLLYGLSLAGLSLVRAALLPFAFVALVWFIFRTRTVHRGWLAALLAFLGFANGLAPWTVRNVQAFGEPVPVVDSAYVHLWVGNNPAADGGPLKETMLATAPEEELRAIPRQTTRYNRLALNIVEEVRDRPAETLWRRLRAFFVFLVGERWLTDGTAAERTAVSEGEAGMPPWLENTYRLLLQASLLVLILLGALGWRWSYAWRWESMPAVLAVLWGTLPYILSHGEYLSGPRLPLDGVLLCFVAVILAGVNPFLRDHLFRGPQTGDRLL